MINWFKPRITDPDQVLAAQVRAKFREATDLALELKRRGYDVEGQYFNDEYLFLSWKDLTKTKGIKISRFTTKSEVL